MNRRGATQRQPPLPQPSPPVEEKEKTMRFMVTMQILRILELSMNHTAAGVRANDAAAGLRHSRGPWFMVPMHARSETRLSMNRRADMPLRWRLD